MFIDLITSWTRWSYVFIDLRSLYSGEGDSFSSFFYKLRNQFFLIVARFRTSTAYFVSNWLVSTNHRRIAVMYFLFIVVTAFSGLLLATIIRVELAFPGVSFLNNNSEKYLTLISIHAFVMVFFVIIPLLFGAFGNFLLPTQLGVRDVAFPRLNSFMFWVTPSGFVLLMHIFFFDKHPAVVGALPTCSGESRSSHLRSSDWSTQVVSSDDEVMFISYISDEERLALFGNLPPQLKLEAESTNALYRLFGFLDNLVLNFFKLTSFALTSDSIARTGDVGVNASTQKSYASDAARVSELMNSTSNSMNIGSSNLSSDIVRPVSIKVSSWVSNQLIAGWALVTPYSSRIRYTAVGKIDIALVVVFMAGLGSIFSAVNYVITYRCVSAPAFKNRRELRPFFADALLVASRMMIAANPALLIAILFLLSDRHLGTSVFDFSGGGDAVLFQHLFWFFGHPEVYIIVIPCFGFANSLMPHFLRKRLSGRLSLQFSMYTIGFMGFAVWGHHMYMVGLANTTRTLYSTMTVMISVPASTKVLHWCVTLVNSAPQMDVSFLFLIAFTYFFTLGGLSGMFNAHIGFDVSLHDTFYVIGHFHVMLAGAAFSCSFAAFYFYFGAIFGVQYSKLFAYLHFFFYFFGQLFTVIPMFWLGYAGMPRRIMDYPAFFGGWHSIISGGHFLTTLGSIFFLLMLIDSFYEATAPVSATLGVPRLNTRLAFYTYSRAKLNLSSTSYAGLAGVSSISVARGSWPLESNLRSFVLK